MTTADLLCAARAVKPAAAALSTAEKNRLLEAMAQVGAVAILSLPENQGKIALFGGVKNARFRRKVIPGDVLEMECVLTKRRGPVGIGECKATVNGELACTAELTFAIGAE